MDVSLSRASLLVAFVVTLVIIGWCPIVLVAEQEGDGNGYVDSQKPNKRTSPEEGMPRPADMVHSGVPNCLSGKDTTVCENSSLPLLVFVVGVEGSGHHLVEALIGRLSSYHMCEWIPGYHLYDPIGNGDLSKLYYTIVEKDLYRERFQHLMNLFSEAKASNKSGVALVINSFPMGYRSGMYATARPDLLDLKSFECKLYRIKFLVTRRHPLAAVISSVTRFNKERFTKYGGLSRIPAAKRSDLDEKTLPYSVRARITEDNLIYIDQQLRRLGCHQVFFVDNDRFVAETTRQSSLQALATFLELSDSERHVLQSTKLRAPITKIDIPPLCDHCIERMLYDFFEERKMMWPLMNPQ